MTYTRGTDLSGSLQGAGGIGGLLARTDGNGSAFYHADGNGNITCLLDASGNICAKYLYDPFGNLLSQSGSLASVNRYRFSSKAWDSNSGLYYYLYRFYDPNLQRWLNRDPLGDIGGMIFAIANIDLHLEAEAAAMQDPLDVFTRINLNLFGALANDPNDQIDPLGLCNCWAHCMKESGAYWALGALGLSSTTAGTLPFKPRAGVLGSGSITTGLSLLQHYTGVAVRQIARRLNPLADVISAGAAGYLVGLSASCAAICASNPNAF